MIMYDIGSYVFLQVTGACQITVCSGGALMHDSWHFQHCTKTTNRPRHSFSPIKKGLKHASHAESFIRLYKSSLIYYVARKKEIDVYFVNEKSTNRSLSHTIF